MMRLSRDRPRAVGFAGLMLIVLALAGPSPAGAQTMDDMNYLFLMVNELEQAPNLAERPVRLGGEAWYGGDYNRLWMKVHGDASTRESEGDLETQLLFSRLVSPWWDLQAGIRVDHAWGEGTRTRPHLALGIQGLAPYWFEVESSLFVDDDGNVSAEVDAGYELLFSQSLILEPEVAVGVAFQDVPEWGIAAGIHDFEVGARLRYEIRREFAPYVGWVWQRAFGDTADLLRAGGAPYREGSLVFGIRAWY
ncbi:MAG: copper resistance protein B [Gemmatimonadota bacterium]|nr:copper resistance protein B [Gemmatimonadota bacterium]